jgi:D-glycero-D-manno-heptose 1,7-bisphosphate phosphatase
MNNEVIVYYCYEKKRIFLVSSTPFAPVPTLFLDRDGVLNHRILDGYVTRPAELIIREDALEALTLLSRHPMRIAVVTNQRGIARNMYQISDVATIHQLMRQQFLSTGMILDEFYICPHDHTDGCPCRKPKPGLLLQAHARTPVAWTQSWLVGDSDSDTLAAQAMGVRAIQLTPPHTTHPHRLARNLTEAVEHIMEDRHV